MSNDSTEYIVRALNQLDPVLFIRCLLNNSPEKIVEVYESALISEPLWKLLDNDFWNCVLDLNFPNIHFSSLRPSSSFSTFSHPYFVLHSTPPRPIAFEVLSQCFIEVGASYSSSRSIFHIEITNDTESFGIASLVNREYAVRNAYRRSAQDISIASGGAKPVLTFDIEYEGRFLLEIINLALRNDQLVRLLLHMNYPSNRMNDWYYFICIKKKGLPEWHLLSDSITLARLLDFLEGLVINWPLKSSPSKTTSRFVLSIILSAGLSINDSTMYINHISQIASCAIKKILNHRSCRQLEIYLTKPTTSGFMFHDLALEFLIGMGVPRSPLLSIMSMIWSRFQPASRSRFRTQYEITTGMALGVHFPEWIMSLDLVETEEHAKKMVFALSKSVEAALDSYVLMTELTGCDNNPLAMIEITRLLFLSYATTLAGLTIFPFPTPDGGYVIYGVQIRNINGILRHPETKDFTVRRGKPLCSVDLGYSKYQLNSNMTFPPTVSIPHISYILLENIVKKDRQDRNYEG